MNKPLIRHLPYRYEEQPSPCVNEILIESEQLIDESRLTERILGIVRESIYIWLCDLIKLDTQLNLGYPLAGMTQM